MVGLNMGEITKSATLGVKLLVLSLAFAFSWLLIMQIDIAGFLAGTSVLTALIVIAAQVVLLGYLGRKFFRLG